MQEFSLFQPLHRMLAGMLLSTLAVGNAQEAGRKPRRWPVNILKDTFQVTADTPSEVPLGSLLQGCPRRDCIPSLEQPRFVTATQATFLKDTDQVLAVSVEGIRRAYPTSILVRHEIVNDTLGTQPIAITYCPLCGSGAAYSRVVGGVVTTFGVSGLLYESDLVLYDRRTKSLWPQILGRAILGRSKGQALKPVPLVQVDWRTWRTQHPDTAVLSPETGFGYAYGEDPYGDYASNPRTMFPITHRNDRLHAKTVVFGVLLEGEAAALSQGFLKAHPQVTLELAGHRIQLQRLADGQVVGRDLEVDKEIPVQQLFWFAWATHYPGTTMHALPSEGR